MELLFGLIIFILFGAGNVILDRKRAESIGNKAVSIDIVDAFFEKLGVPRKKSSFFQRQNNRGFFRNHEVILRGDDCRGTFIAVVQITHGAMDTGIIDILKKSGPDPFGSKAADQVFSTGDEIFDVSFQVTAPDELAAVSLLGPEVRRKLADIAGSVDYFHFTEKQCSAGIDADRTDAVEVLVDATNRLMSFIDDLSAGGDYRLRLMENLRRETIAAMKMRNIIHLTSAFQGDDEIRGLLISLMNDKDTGVQFEASCRLGNTGMKHITRLLKTGKLAGGNLEMAVAVLGKNRFTGAIPVLRKMYAGSEAGMKVEILRAFREMADPGLDGFLAGETRSRNREVRLQAVKALATCGTVASVEPLHRLAGRKGDPVLAVPARESMEAIQARLVGKKGGWLSVSETGEMDGALSRGDGPVDGALSIDQEGHPSKKRKGADR